MDRPEWAVDVPKGAVVTLWTEQKRSINDRRIKRDKHRKNKSGVKKKIKKKNPVTITVEHRYEVRKKETCTHLPQGCKTNVEVWTVVLKNGKKVKEFAHKPEVHKPSKKNRNAKKSKGGAVYLRVRINGQHHYLHVVCAYAFHSQRFASKVKVYDKRFRDRFEGDHLPDRRLRTKTGWCIAGWIEAVPNKDHTMRSTMLAEARLVEEVVDELLVEERKEEKDTKVEMLDATAALKALEKKHSLEELEKKKKAQWEALLLRKQIAEANLHQWRTEKQKRSLFDELVRSNLEFDIDPNNPYGGGRTHEEFLANPFLEYIFVDSGLPPRQALIAKCMQKVYRSKKKYANNEQKTKDELRKMASEM